jgi:hypothetical protein
VRSGGRGAIALPLIGILVAGACASTASPTPLDREAAAQALLAGIRIEPNVSAVQMDATGAIADFGLSGGVHLVRVRIVDQLSLSLRVTADRTVAFTEAPRLCLVGPDSSPDDAGLSDPCWGDPDLGELFSTQLKADADGHLTLEAGRPISVGTTLKRGNERCDYAPGAWHLEMKVDPVVEGEGAGARYLSNVPFDVPIAASAPLPFLLDTRFCALATRISQDQGEPPVQSP